MDENCSVYDDALKNMFTVWWKVFAEQVRDQ